MKPDMEDYTDIDEAAVEPRSRAMSWMVLAVAVGGFGALAYYAYQSGSKPAGEGEMLVVEADSAPIKEAPVDPEGEQFANKDKTIYDVIAPNGEQKTEKLLPDPEHPVVAANTEDAAPAATATVPATSTYVAPSEAKKADPLDLALSKEGGVEKTATAAPAATAPAPTTVTAPAEQAVTTVAEVPVVTKPKAVAEKSFDNPQMINEKPAPKKEAAKPAAKPKSTGGSGVIQLGAFKSEP